MAKSLVSKNIPASNVPPVVGSFASLRERERAAEEFNVERARHWRSIKTSFILRRAVLVALALCSGYAVPQKVHTVINDTCTEVVEHLRSLGEKDTAPAAVGDWPIQRAMVG